MSRRVETEVFENAQILFRNFAGKENKCNHEGQRNFCVRIDDPVKAQRMADEGWNVKISKPREEGDEPYPYLPVKVSYDNFPPRIYTVTRKKKTLLEEASIDQLDSAYIDYVDLEVRPYHYNINGKTGIAAYVKTMYVVLDEDVFADKYAEEEYPE